ncbi:MAG: YncE family protein [Gammaproteobacteria bacterium]|nr:YncE family protein [Gammaproteobacteria bacterium]MDH5652906.1 YncE family protein [Gammaproteobacteria bacterium]
MSIKINDHFKLIRHRPLIKILSALALSITLTCSAAQQTGTEPGKQDKQAANTIQKQVKNGVSIEFFTDALNNPQVQEGEYAELKFRISDAQTGAPVKGIYPAVWIDMAEAWNRKKSDKQINNCKDRVSLYLQGIVGMRPMVDLNSYFVLVMNQDKTISVIDPIIGITGITKLYTSINMKAPGGDWAKSKDEQTLYVSLPTIGEVAVIDLTTFSVKGYIKAGKMPLRISLQPDEKYLWVANDNRKAANSGVTVIDIAKRKPVKFIKTGTGHHELTFSHNSRHAYITNRDNGTISVLDTAKLRKVKTIKDIKQPIGIAYSAMSESLYAVDGKQGEILVIGAAANKVNKRIKVKQGVGPIGVSQDGRWVIAANTHQDEIYVIDVSTNTVAHTIAVENKPYQVAFSRAFVYIRSLGSERVNLIELAHLGKKETVPVLSFAAGQGAPGKVPDLSIAQAIHEAPGEAAVLVVSPTDNTVYYYMEGMNAPMGNFRNYGHRPRAVQVADRTLQEKEPGVYSAKVKVPAAGTFDVAFLMESPSILHCFSMKSEPSAKLAAERRNKYNVAYLEDKRKVKVDEEVTVRVKLINPETDQPHIGLKDVTFRYYRAPAFDRKEAIAKEVSEGVYELKTRLPKTGLYYFHVGSDTANSKVGSSPYISVQVVNGVS